MTALDTEALIAWMLGNDTGLSSKCIAATVSGVRGDRQDHPYDMSDFGRCRRLVESVGGVRERLPMVADVSPVWRRIVQRWDDICTKGASALRLALKDDSEPKPEFCGAAIRIVTGGTCANKKPCPTHDAEPVQWMAAGPEPDAEPKPETHIPFRPMESVHEALDRVGAPRNEDCDGPAGQRPLTPQQRIGWLQHRLRISESEITLLKHAMSSAAAHAIEAYNRLR